MSEEIQNVENNDVQNTEVEEQEVDKLELTPEELQSKIDSETDKRIAKALETHRKKWEEEFKQKLEEEKREAERLAKLSERERKEEELRKREEEIEKRLRELEMKELKADAVADLNEKGLPAEFADFLLADNAENTLKNINVFKEAFDKAVNEAVKEKLRQDTPKVSGGTSGFTNKKLSEMSYLERLELKQNNPELYKKLAKGE